MIEAVKNYQIGKAYKQMLFTEAKINPVAALDAWEKQYSKTSKNPKRLGEALKKLKELIQSSQDNVELMDELTGEFLVVSKLVDNTDATDELSNILQKL